MSEPARKVIGIVAHGPYGPVFTKIHYTRAAIVEAESHGHKFWALRHPRTQFAATLCGVMIRWDEIYLHTDVDKNEHEWHYQLVTMGKGPPECQRCTQARFWGSRAWTGDGNADD